MTLLRWVLAASLALNLAGLGYAAWRWSRREPAWVDHIRTEHIQLFERVSSSARIVLLGDSLTDRGEWADLLGEPVANRGIPGETIDGLRTRLAASLHGTTPSVIAVMIGINDLSFGRTVEQVAADHDRLLTELVPLARGARIVVQSLLPVRPPEAIPVATIRAVNDRLRALCARHGCTYLDITAPFTGPDGLLLPELTLDGIHLSGDAYLRWRDALRPAL